MIVFDVIIDLSIATVFLKMNYLFIAVRTLFFRPLPSHFIFLAQSSY